MVMGKLRALAGSAARCVEFAILTAAHPAHALGLCGSRVDFARAVWHAAEEGSGRRYRPLSDRALHLLRQQHSEGACDLLFPSPGGDALSLSAFAEVVRGIAGDEALPSTFRLTFGFWAARAHPGDVVLTALGLRSLHEGPSHRFQQFPGSGRFEKARALLEEWSRLCA